MDTETRFTVANSYDELERVAAQVAAFCTRHDRIAPLEQRLLLAIEELLSNTIDYGYDASDTAPHDIDIRLALDQDWLTIVYQDDARPFDPTQAKTPDMEGTVEERPVGGLGIHLVMTIMASVAYERIGSHNRLTMRMALQKE